MTTQTNTDIEGSLDYFGITDFLNPEQLEEFKAALLAWRDRELVKELERFWDMPAVNLPEALFYRRTELKAKQEEAHGAEELPIYGTDSKSRC
jgi:hypothetical protein